MIPLRFSGFTIFQPTRPLRGATGGQGGILSLSPYFNPRAPCGARRLPRRLTASSATFQPTRPLRGATLDFVGYEINEHYYISTHAPLAGRDCINVVNVNTLDDISTHAPLAGRDYKEMTKAVAGHISTHAPLAGRDGICAQLHCGGYDFNPRAPCGARQQKCTNHYAHFCDNRQISDAFAQNAACQGILLLFDAGKPCGFWVRTAQVISARLCFAL